MRFEKVAMAINDRSDGHFLLVDFLLSKVTIRHRVKQRIKEFHREIGLNVGILQIEISNKKSSFDRLRNRPKSKIWNSESGIQNPRARPIFAP
jgi:hypothetical protein